VRIGELAARAEVTAKALRHYERLGLIPAPLRTAAGYRDYGQGALRRVQFIVAGQRVGLSLRQLRQILEVRERGEAPCAHALVLVNERLRDVEEAIAHLTALQAELTLISEQGRAIDPADCDEACVCAVINPPHP
jgi:DNA-binding transcriptional MerR regulator